MNRFFRQILFISTFLFLICTAKAQNITGIWRGYFITDFSDQYKFELQIVQNNTNRVTGVSYSYLDTRFYGKAALTGYFTRSSKSALIQETKTVEVRMSAGSVACIMKCNFTYVKSGNEEFLEGEYTSTYEKTSAAEGIQKGGNCGGGRIYLRKVPTSDFYVEPFLRDQPLVNTPSNTKPPATKSPATKPPVAKSKTPATKTPPAKTQPAKNPPAVAKKTTPTQTPAQKTTVTKPKTTEIEQPKTEITKNEAPKKIEVPKTFIPAQTRARTNELTKTLTVSNEEITVKLYDNGEIDGDTISVYLDNKPILSNKLLTAAPLTIQLKMDESNPEHVLIMVAENLGRIPPNTSLMIVQDGDTRHEVRITSTEQKNAMVRFRYQKSTP